MGCKIRDKRNAEVDSLFLSDYSHVALAATHVYVKDRSCNVCANRCCGSPPSSLFAILALLIEALTGRRQFVPIDRQLTSVPETEMSPSTERTRHLGSRTFTYVRADQT